MALLEYLGFVEVGVLFGIFYRIGTLTTEVSNVKGRIKKLEGAIHNV